MLPDLIAWLVALIASLISPVITLNSLQQIDDYPLYTMQYFGSYEQNIAIVEAAGELPHAGVVGQSTASGAAQPAWACSLFAAFADPDSAVYGRNFDWTYSPAVLLFTHPPDGYASVSMVDIAYLGFPDSRSARRIAEMPLAERAPLIYAPLLPFDGMNETGLAIGMAAVSGSEMPYDPARPTVGSLGIIREVLDHARSVDEAVAIFESFNVDMGGGPPIHYLIVDAAGRSVLIEFYNGEMIVQPNAQPWDVATNFIRAAAGRSPERMCARYRTISAAMADQEGRLTSAEALDLLRRVAQGSTQWSIVYSLATGEIHVAMGRHYDSVYTLYLRLAEE
jgi:hypothetical protein